MYLAMGDAVCQCKWHLPHFPVSETLHLPRMRGQEWQPAQELGEVAANLRRPNFDI